MSYKDSLKKMIHAHRTGHQEVFTAAAREIIALERERGHNRVADELEKALVNGFSTEKKMSPLPKNGVHFSGSSKSIPLSKGDQIPLIEIREPRFTYDDIILNTSTKHRLHRIIHEQTHRSELANYGLQPINKILFYGPPGCGKTLAANVISGLLGWQMLYARFDSIISSYLGETSTNLRRVFDFGSNDLFVLFFDEFDAIGKSRDIDQEVGELKRVVNSFLQMIDNFRGDTIIITATNHENLLDSALWRRFDEVVYFPMPSQKEIAELLKLRLRNVRIRDFIPEHLAANFANLSYSDITHICVDSIKKMILDHRTQLTKQDVLISLDDFFENRPKN